MRTGFDVHGATSRGLEPAGQKEDEHDQQQDAAQAVAVIHATPPTGCRARAVPGETGPAAVQNPPWSTPAGPSIRPPPVICRKRGDPCRAGPSELHRS